MKIWKILSRILANKNLKILGNKILLLDIKIILIPIPVFVKFQEDMIKISKDEYSCNNIIYEVGNLQGRC